MTRSPLLRLILVLLLPIVLGAAAPGGVADSPLAAKIEKSYGIKVVMTPPQPTDPKTRFKPLSSSIPELQTYLTLFDEELARYSPALLKCSGLKTFAPVQDLTGNGEWGPFSYDFVKGVLYCNVKFQESGKNPDQYLRHTIHHEIAHAVDRALNGWLISDDPKWMLLNPPAFRYGAGGASIRAGFRADHSDASPGFFSLYSKAAVAEDKAEVFAGLMLPAEAAQLEKLIARDKVLEGKAKYWRDVIDFYRKPLPNDDRQQKVDALLEFIRTRDAKRSLREEEAILKSVGVEPFAVPGAMGRTPLHIAILFRHDLLIAKAMYQRVDVTIADNDGWTPLHFATFMNNPFLVRDFLEAGADPKAKDRFAGTPLDWAQKRGSPEMLRQFRNAPKPRAAGRKP